MEKLSYCQMHAYYKEESLFLIYKESWTKLKHFAFARNGIKLFFYALQCNLLTSCYRLFLACRVKWCNRETDNIIFFAKCLGFWQFCLLQRYVLRSICCKFPQICIGLIFACKHFAWVCLWGDLLSGGGIRRYQTASNI